MIYPNVLTAAESLGRKLYSFAGHSINPTHTSYCFDQLARAVCYIAKCTAARAVSFEAELYIDGKALPVFVTIKGEDIFKPVEVLIRSSIPECE